MSDDSDSPCLRFRFLQNRTSTLQGQIQALWIRGDGLYFHPLDNHFSLLAYPHLNCCRHCQFRMVINHLLKLHHMFHCRLEGTLVSNLYQPFGLHKPCLLPITRRLNRSYLRNSPPTLLRLESCQLLLRLGIHQRYEHTQVIRISHLWNLLR